MTARSTIDVEFLRGEWMVVQRMNAEDTREVAYGLSPRDGAREDLFKAADEAEHKNKMGYVE